MREVSKTNAALILVAVAVISILGTAIILSSMGRAPLVTGLVGSTGTANVTVQGITGIRLNITDVEFGNENTGAENDTTDEAPGPIVIENNGSNFLNVTVKVNETIFDNNGSNNSMSFRYKIDNCSATPVPGCSAGEATWCYDFLSNVSNALEWNIFSVDYDTKLVGKLNYTNSCDVAEVDIYIKVPDDEPPEAKSALITFTGVQSV